MRDTDEQNDNEEQSSLQIERSTNRLRYYLQHICSRRVIVILIAISLIYNFLTFSFSKEFSCEQTPSPNCVSTLKNNNLDELDEFANKINIWNNFQSKYQAQSIAAREKYWDEVSKVDITLVDPTTNQLLIAISTLVPDFQRRQIMRAHQINVYKNHHPNVQFRFFIARPQFIYTDAIIFENNIYGDIVVLEDLEDSRHIAKAIKTFEIYKYVERHMSIYKYVAKMERDEFVNVTGLNKHFLTPNVLDSAFAIIARFVKHDNFDWPEKGFQALSWKLMLFINRLYETVNRTTLNEDMQVAWYLHDAGIDYTRVKIDEQFYKEVKRTAANVIDCDAIFLHELKAETDYLIAAKGFYNEDARTVSMTDYFIKNRWYEL